MSRSPTLRDRPATARLVPAPPPPIAASPGPFAELLGLFAWGEGQDERRTLGALERAHLEAVVGRLNAHLAPPLRAELEALPDDSYLSLVRSPEAYHAVFYRPLSALDESLRGWLAARKARLGEPTPLFGARRTAELDRVVTARDGKVVTVAPLARLGKGPLLDVEGDLPARMVTRFPERALATPTQQELAAAVDKLDDAVSLLRAISPVASALVADTTQVLCLRTAVGDPRFFTASDATTIGVVHLYNAHLPRKTAYEIASELVHEAIHQALFRWELRHPLLADTSRSTAKVRSPWTGASLDVYAFLHACFVWYGVANLWRLSAAPSEPVVARQRAAAESGFAADPLACLGAHTAALSPALRATVQEMVRVMRQGKQS